MRLFIAVAAVDPPCPYDDPPKLLKQATVLSDLIPHKIHLYETNFVKVPCSAKCVLNVSINHESLLPAHTTLASLLSAHTPFEISTILSTPESAATPADHERLHEHSTVLSV